MGDVSVHVSWRKYQDGNLPDRERSVLRPTVRFLSAGPRLGLLVEVGLDRSGLGGRVDDRPIWLLRPRRRSRGDHAHRLVVAAVPLVVPGRATS
jgi:hypothetical protein